MRSIKRLIGNPQLVFEWLMGFLQGQLRVQNEELVALRKENTDLREQAVVREAVVTSLRSEVIRLQDAANRDPLTGLLNRRGLEEVIPSVLSHARRKEQPFCACVVDIDHFKRINDDHDYFAGDVVLGHVASVLLSQVRGSDYVARLGGEEFALLLPETKIEDALLLSDRIRMHVAQNPIKVNDKAISVTISIGIAEWCKEENVDYLLRRADVAMYKAKRTGRNKVVLS